MLGLMGVDGEGLYRAALRLAGRMQFEGMSWHLAHFQPPFAPVQMPVAPEEELMDAIGRERASAEELLQLAADQACMYKLDVKTHLKEGSAARGMMSLADHLQADLLAIGCRQVGPLAAAMVGSVGRALTIGAGQSILIGRDPVSAAGDVSAVFATDHSPYCQKALRRLIELKPRGLRAIHLVTAYDIGELTDTAQYTEIYKEAASQGLTVFDRLKQQSESEIRRLREAGYQATYELRPGRVDKAIDRAMEQHPSDLLIMGAQGHGFIERLVVGSTALHQAVSEMHSVLILRPQAKT